MTAKEVVTQVFARWEQGDQTSFFDALAEDMQWTAIGSTPISGHYTSKAEYLEKVYQPLRAHFSGPTHCQVKQILAEGDTVVVQWQGETPTQSGRLYVQEYCWVLRVHGEQIQEVTGHFDTAAVRQLLAVP